MFQDHPLFTLENIYRAYRRCRKRKRNTVNAMRFEQNLEENLVSLHEELTSGSYRPGRSVAFLVEKPKRRFHKSRLPAIKDALWESGAPVAWIRETGRRITRINERSLVGRWPGVSDQRPLSLLYCV